MKNIFFLLLSVALLLSCSQIKELTYSQKKSSNNSYWQQQQLQNTAMEQTAIDKNSYCKISLLNNQLFVLTKKQLLYNRTNGVESTGGSIGCPKNH